MGLSEVSNILWRERKLIELLLFKMEAEQLFLSAGRTRFIAEATREVEMVINELKETEVMRSIAVDQVATELGLQPSPSLKELADAVPAPWNTILEEHRKAFLDDTQELSTLARVNKEMLASGHKAARDALEWFANGGQAPAVEAQPDAYSAAGTAAATTASGAKLIDEAI